MMNERLVVINITFTFEEKLFLHFYRANTAHYLIHGCHHKHPMDGLRLVFPPAAAAILSIPVCYFLLLPPIVVM